MAPWKKLLSISANLGKYEKEEKQKYKQYVKIEKQNAQLRSKPESEVYEDVLLLRSKSSRRSSKKRKAPAPHTIENAYEIIEGQSSNNVVVINDDLRNRFAGYELPKTQENLYVVVQPHEAEVENPRRLRRKKIEPIPQQNLTSPDNKLQEKTNPKPKPKGILRVPEDDHQDTSMSEEFYDCEEYLEIPILNTPKTNLTKTNPNYDSTSEGSLTRSHAEYDTYEDYYENQRVYNRYSGEDFGPEDDSRWQPSNIRFCEMSGDEEEQQIYGPFGTFEVANYENTLNSRIRMVLETERYSVMQSLEDQRNEEAADEIDGAEVEKVFEFTGSGTYLDPNEDSFGAVGAFEMDREDEEVSVEAKNIALIEDLEEPKKDENVGHDLKGSAPSNLYEEIHEDIQTAKDIDHHLSIPIPSKPPDNNEANIRKEEKNDRAEQKESPTSPQVASPLEKDCQEDVKEIPQVEAETKENPQPSSSSFRLIDNYSAFLKDPMSMMAPRLSSSSFKTKQGDPKLNETTERKENGDAYENLQYNRSTRKEKSPPHLKKSLRPTSSMPSQLSLRSSSKMEQDYPKPSETTQRKVNDDAYENFQLNRSARKEESPSHLKKSPHVTPRYHKTPVAQPRLNLSKFKRNRPLGQTENDFETLQNKEERGNSKLEGEAQPQNVTSDLFNGLPVESEELDHETCKEDQNKGNSRETEAKNIDHELFNGVPVTRQEILNDKSKLNDDVVSNEDNLKIPWETKPKISSNDGNTFTHFSTLKEEEVQSEILEISRNTKPVEGTPAFSNNAKEEEVQNEILNIPWETNPDEDTSNFFYNVKEEDVPNETLEIPWGTRPKMSSINTFVPFSKTPEEESANSKKPEQVQKNFSTKLNLPKTSEGVQNEAKDHEHIKLDEDSEIPGCNVNSKIPRETRPKNLKQYKNSSVRLTSSNFDDDVIAVSNEPISPNEFPVKEKLITPEELGQNSSEVNINFQKDIQSSLPEKSGFLDKPADTDVHPKELRSDISELRDLARDENTIWGSNPSVEVGRLKQDSPSLDTRDSISENFIVGLERSHSLKEKTWHVSLLEKYESPNLNRHQNEAGTKNPNINGEDAINLAIESEKIQPAFTIEQIIVDDKAQKGETQNEANILEGNFRILRGFDVAKEEGIIYHNVHNTPDPPQRPFKRTKIPKKVSFRTNETADVSDESPNTYVPAYSPTENIGYIKKSAKLEAITRKLDRTHSLQHPISLIEAEKPKPNFSTFPRNASRIQSLRKRSDLERLQEVLSGINDLASVHEQVSAMEDVSNKVKERVDKVDRSGAESEYSKLLQIMFKSVRIATVLDCGFDPDLLARQQTVLDEIRNSISTLSSK